MVKLYAMDTLVGRLPQFHRLLAEELAGLIHANSVGFHRMPRAVTKDRSGLYLAIIECCCEGLLLLLVVLDLLLHLLLRVCHRLQ